MLLTLIVAIALAVVLARSLNHSLRRLREGALAVANRDLPDAVQPAARRRQPSARAASRRSSARCGTRSS